METEGGVRATQVWRFEFVMVPGEYIGEDKQDAGHMGKGVKDKMHREKVSGSSKMMTMANRKQRKLILHNSLLQ